MEKILCLECGKELTEGRRKFCSNYCVRESILRGKRENYKPNYKIVSCGICKKQFTSSTRCKKYCDDCSKDGFKYVKPKQPNVDCIVCGRITASKTSVCRKCNQLDDSYSKYYSRLDRDVIDDNVDGMKELMKRIFRLKGITSLDAFIITHYYCMLSTNINEFGSMDIQEQLDNMIEKIISFISTYRKRRKVIFNKKTTLE